MANEFVKPTEAELEILHVLWAYGAQSVRFVNDKLNEQRDPSVGYTSTLKTMQVMHEKGLVARDDSARSHIYAAAMPQTETQRNLVKNFVDSAFKGSAMQLVMQALGNHEASDSELAEIKALIEQMEKK
ncbi:MAG: BlaI/MecI/CopY family transcriptional regulator [Saprospiraceae bacterium]|nr:BlaI/MecI/CopY family transcriptional regulator [Saprospiraceae bacterium]